MSKQLQPDTVMARARASSGNKYGARAVEIDGHRFASQKEAARYGELLTLEKEGKICYLLIHPVYRFVVNGVLIGRYTPDFSYLERHDAEAADRLVVEDVKGGSATKTEAYVLRKKLMLACHGIAVSEV